ncbi:unnamed protein product [Prorocentrum cordatum]|uniref:Uncharacterized protein n=1 Tax=Prorocentrum cordatum TaxID=2364126 RepID=A0ABN9X5M6_9DINO|nr:unnamed protein product [Polarella glacialis]
MPVPWVFRYFVCEMGAMNVKVDIRVADRARQVCLSSLADAQDTNPDRSSLSAATGARRAPPASRAACRSRCRPFRSDAASTASGGGKDLASLPVSPRARARTRRGAHPAA